MSDNHQPSDRTPNAERSSPLSSLKPSTQMHMRNVASSDAGRRPPADIAADKSEIIRDVKSATVYLRKANYIQQNEDITIPNLVDALFYLSADESSNKTTTNVSRAVAILLRDCVMKMHNTPYLFDLVHFSSITHSSKRSLPTLIQDQMILQDDKYIIQLRIATILSRYETEGNSPFLLRNPSTQTTPLPLPPMSSRWDSRCYLPQICCSQ